MSRTLTAARRRCPASVVLSRRAALRRLNRWLAVDMWTVRRRRTAMWPRAVARWVLPTPTGPSIKAPWAASANRGAGSSFRRCWSERTGGGGAQGGGPQSGAGPAVRGRGGGGGWGRGGGVVAGGDEVVQEADGLVLPGALAVQGGLGAGELAAQRGDGVAGCG